MLRRLRRMRDDSGFTNRDIAEATGIPESTINKIFTGVVKEPTLSKVSAIVHFLGYTLDDLSESGTSIFSVEEKTIIKKYRTLDEYGKEAVEKIIDIESKRCIDQTIELPLSDLRASAGGGEYLSEASAVMVKVRTSAEALKADIVIPVSGDSMLPKFRDGDKVLVKRQPDVDIGEIGIFIMDGEAFIKQKGSGELISLNPQYENVKGSEFSDSRCFGKVLGIAEVIEI